MHKEMNSSPELIRLHELFNFALEHFRSFVVNRKEIQERGNDLVGISLAADPIGIAQPIIERYKLGYAMNCWDLLKKAGRKRPQAFTYAEMAHAGLLHLTPKKSYDLFRGRIMAPILHPDTGQCIGFAGRLLVNKDGFPKEVYSHNVWLFKRRDKVTVFKKDHQLFGFFQAKQEIKRQNVVYVTSDFFDVLRLAQAGIPNSVSSMGIPYTLKQAKQLKSVTDNVVLIYFSDRPGSQAAKQRVDVFLAAGLSLKIVVIEKNIRKIQADELKNILLNRREDYILFKSQQVLEGKNKLPSALEKELKSVARTISYIGQPLTRELYLKQVAEMAGVPVHLLKEVLHGVDVKRREETESKINRSTKIEFTPPQSSSFDRLSTSQQQELELVRLLLRHNQRPVRGEVFVDLVLRDLTSANINITDTVLWELSRLTFEARSKGIVPDLNYFKNAEAAIVNAAKEILFPAFSIRELQPTIPFKGSATTKLVNELKMELLLVKLEEVVAKLNVPDVSDADKEKYLRIEDSISRTINQHKNVFRS